VRTLHAANFLNLTVLKNIHYNGAGKQDNPEFEGV
jgi:hypothetical protein